MRIKVLIQARLGSTRFPKKIMEPICKGVTVLEFLIERILLSSNILKNDVVICTTDNNRDDELCNYVENTLGLACFRGSEHDVFSRFYEYLIKNPCDVFFRVCSDNPFISPKFLDSLYGLACEYSEDDYWSFASGEKPTILTHYGFFGELIKYESFMRAAKMLETYSPEYREHVTPIFYREKKVFSSRYIQIPDFLKAFSDIRLTIDTPQDLINVKKLIHKIGGFKEYQVRDLIVLLKNDQKLMHSMSLEKIENRK